VRRELKSSVQPDTHDKTEPLIHTPCRQLTVLSPPPTPSIFTPSFFSSGSGRLPSRHKVKMAKSFCAGRLAGASISRLPLSDELFTIPLFCHRAAGFCFFLPSPRPAIGRLQVVELPRRPVLAAPLATGRICVL